MASTTTSPVSSRKEDVTISSYIHEDLTTKSELEWAFRVVSSHFSYNLSKDLVMIFKAVFLDSNIAKHYIGSTKLYLISHGLAPYFHEKIIKSVESKFVIFFHEAFNEVSKEGQINGSCYKIFK